MAELPDGTLLVTGISAPAIGDIARDHDIALHELTPRTGSLEEAYMALTEQSVEYKTKDIA